MNNRILAALFALALALFIGVAPVEAEAAHQHVDTDNDYVCDRSGCSVHVHHLSHFAATDATCTGNGNIEYWQCLGGSGACKKCYTDEAATTEIAGSDTVLAVTEHVDEDKNCVCDVCNASLRHKLTKVPGTAPTCEKPGEWGHYECEVCHRLFSESDSTREVTAEAIVRPAIGHASATVWSNDESGHWHACTNDSEEQLDFAAHSFEQKPGNNNHWMECTVCGYQKDVTAHVWEWKSNGDYSGKHVATCTVCGKVYNAEGDACVDNDGDCHCDYCKAPMPHHWDASNMKYVAKKDPTCLEDGYPEHEECKICHVWIQYGDKVIAEADKVIPATGHTEAGWWNKDATGHWHRCTVCATKITTEEHTFEWVSEGDQHWQRCTVCGYETEKEGHDWDRVSNGDGTHTTKCTKCFAVMGNQTWECQDSRTDDDCVCDGCGGPVEHDKYQMNAHAAVAATCTETGMRPYWDCPFCGKLFVDGKDGKLEEVTDVTTEALGHNWKYVKDTLNGQHLLKCTGCKAYQTSGHVDSDEDCLCDIGDCDTPVHSHTYIHVARVEPTCGKEGTEEYLKYEGCGKMFDMDRNPIDAPAVIPALEHEWSEEWEAVEGGHTKKCSHCGETQEVQPHVYANGNPHCTLCGAEEELEYFEGKEPTCTEPGFKEYWKSKVTDRKYSDAAGTQYIVKVEEIPALGHQFDTSEGEQHVCATCGEKEDHVADPENPCFCKICYHLMPGHEMAYVPTVPATCTEDGTRAYFRCSCGKLYDASSLETAGAEIEKPAIIPAIGHKLSGNLVEDTRLGDHYRYCVHDGCDYEIHSEHDCKAEDPLSGNYHQFVCECGYTRSEIHYDKDGDKKCDECGHDMANTTVKVEQHDSIKVTTGDKAKVDNTQSWWKNWWNMLTSSNAGSQTSGNTPAASTTTSGSAAPAESGEKTAATGGSTGAGTGTQSEKPSTGTGSQNITQKPGTETGTQNPGSAPAQNSFRDILFQVWNWLNGLFASK